MNIGVIGLGSIGERHVRNLQSLYPKAHIEVLTKRRSWNGRKRNTHLIANPAVFYATKHDVYFVTNETGKHTETILRCLTNKPKGIFVEKPLCHRLADLERIRKALRSSPTIFFVAYCMQFSKPIQTMRDIFQQGTLGHIMYMRVSAGQDLRTWRNGNYLTRYSANSANGGGVTLDLIHELNYPSWILNEPLSFIMGHSETSYLPISAEDVSDGLYRSRSGVLVSTHQDYLQTPGGRVCEMYGSKGTLSWDGSSTVRIRTKKRTWTLDVSENRNEMYKKELVWFISLVECGKRFSNIDEASRDVKNALAIKSS